MEPLPLRLGDVAELVDEDQEDEPERESPVAEPDREDEERQAERADERRDFAGTASPEPCPIHSSPPEYTSFFQSGIDVFSASIASRHASSAVPRCGAETAMTTLDSPTSTRPRRWWIATAVRPCRSISSA